jgi:hypothetical protein
VSKKIQPVFKRDIRVRRHEARAAKEKKRMKTLLEQVEVRIQAQLTELRSYLEEDPDVAERIADGGHILGDWIRWRINHAARVKEEALGREAMKTEATEADAKPTHQEN